MTHPSHPGRSRHLLSLLLLAALLLPAARLRAQDYYQALQQELQTEHNLPAGEFFFGTTEAEALSKFYMEGYEYFPPADNLTTIDVTGMPFTKALRATSSGTKSYDWSLNVKAKLAKAMRQGDVLLLVVYVRAIDSRDERGLVSARTLIGDSDYHRYSSATGPQWRKQYFQTVVNADIPAGSDKVLQFFLGDRRQTMDIGGLALLTYGTSVTVDQLPKTVIDYNYEGRDPGAPWRAAADARIDQIRKRNLKVVVQDSAGNVLDDAKVEVHMKKHDFKFGTLVHNNELLNNAQYRETFLQNFNWGDVNSKYNIYDDAPVLAQTDQAVNLLRQHGVKVRMNTLVYPQFINTNGVDTPEEAQALLNTHVNYVKNVAGHFKGRIESHNVLNEAGPYPGLDNALQLVLPGKGRPSAEFFKAAHGADPDATLEENGFRMEGADYKRSKTLDSAMLAWNAPLHALGEEWHMGVAGLIPPATLISQIDRVYADFGLPIRATEYDIDADINDPVQAAVQADYTRDFYTALFSHPAVDGINAWGFWEPTMWNTGANGTDNRRAKAWYTNNWEITPVGQAYRDVVFGKYWTNEEGTTDAQGEYLVRAFKGTHEIVATLGRVQSRVTASFVNDTTIVIRLVPDRQAPTQPKNLKATHTATTATLTWDASVDNVKVIGYDVYKGTAKVNAEDVTATTYKVTGLDPATRYAFTVVAKDTAGNRSPASAAIAVTTDSVKLFLTSICSVNPLQTRRWEVRSTFDVPVTYRWAVNGTLLAGTGTVEPNGIAYFEAPNQGGANPTEITWAHTDGTIKRIVKDAGLLYCPTTIVLEDDNYGKSIVYNYKSISRFVSEFRVHSAFHVFEDIHYYISPDNVNWTPIQVSRIGVVQDVGGGWGFAKFASPALPAGTNYLKIEVVNVEVDWATYLDRISIDYDATPATTCADCIEVLDPLDDWTKSYSHTNWYFASDPRDPSLAVRGSLGAENIVYNYPGTKNFAATLIYHTTFPVTVTLAGSADNAAYTNIPYNTQATDVGGGWYRIVYTPQDTLGAGVNFLKLEIAGGTQGWTPMVSQVNIQYRANPCRDCVAASDSLNDWNKTYARTGGWYLAQDANAGPNFADDPSRAVRSAADLQSVTYRYHRIQNFDAAVLSHATFPATVKFYTSPDNVTYAEIPTAYASRETGGGWYRLVYSPTANVPAGTNYLRVEISGGSQAWTPQLSQVNVLYRPVAPVKALALAATCSSRPNRTRNWKVTNPNAKAVSVSWSLAGTTQKGTLLAAPGDNFLSTATAKGTNTLTITWADEYGVSQSRSAVSIKDECTARQSFDTADAGGLRVYPNPARGEFTVVLPATVAGPVQVQVTDMQGRLFSRVEETVREGGRSIRLTTERLPAGLYLIRVVPADGARQVRKLEVIK
jgi:GH35 family endo-1,4-beta-xylanase